MGRPLRFFKPDSIYFITGRCLQARKLMRPSDTINAIIGGVLAKALSLFDIELYAFVFTSNHFHMLLRSQQGHIAKFMQYLRSNLARKVGQHIDWTGKFWDRRYDAAPVLDDEAAIGRMRYILAHGVKEGLVAKCKQWPGLSSLPELTDGIKRSFIWPKALSTTANSSIERHKESNNKKEQENSYALHITQLPCFKGYHKTQVKVMKQQVVEIEAEYLMQRRGKAILGREKILAQHPHDKTMNIKRSPRPLCHATAKDDIAKYKDEYKEFATKYAEASEQYRKAIQNQETEVVAKFPDYSFPPPIIGLMVLVKHAVMWRNTV